ncbi:TIGR04076 family protein [Candidatus Riflebacteria bacterium]
MGKAIKVRVKVIKGKCQGDIHKVGDQFDIGWVTPQGVCLSAWDTLSPYVTALLCGGNLPWEKEMGYAEIHCPDCKGITFELKRLEND